MDINENVKIKNKKSQIIYIKRTVSVATYADECGSEIRGGYNYYKHTNILVLKTKWVVKKNITAQHFCGWLYFRGVGI